MTETALTTRQVTPDVWQMIANVGPVLYRSRIFGATSAEHAMAVMLTAYELGLPFTSGFELIHVIGGKPSLSPRGALALIHRSGLLAGMTIKDEVGACTVSMKRTNGLEYSLQFTIEQARKAGVVKAGSGWDGYEANMLRWRAIGFVEDILFPDVIAGLKRSDELGAEIDTAGDVVDAPVSEASSQTVGRNAGVSVVVYPEEIFEVAPIPTLEDLLKLYTAEQIVAANEGRVPATGGELVAIAVKLAGSTNGA